MKMHKEDFTLIYLNECLSLNDGTGVLTWKVRPGHHFSSERSMTIVNNRFAGLPAGSVKTKPDGTQRMTVGFDSFSFFYHRIVFAMSRGIELSQVPKILDHIDGNPLNNRPGNLRAATPKQNQMNRKVSKISETGVKGVWKTTRGRPYQAAIKFRGYQVPLGRFDSLEEAAAAYRNAAIELHGEFAKA